MGYNFYNNTPIESYPIESYPIESYPIESDTIESDTIESPTINDMIRYLCIMSAIYPGCQN